MKNSFAAKSPPISSDSLPGPVLSFYSLSNGSQARPTQTNISFFNILQLGRRCKTLFSVSPFRYFEINFLLQKWNISMLLGKSNCWRNYLVLSHLIIISNAVSHCSKALLCQNSLCQAALQSSCHLRQIAFDVKLPHIGTYVSDLRNALVSSIVKPPSSHATNCHVHRVKPLL